MPGGIAIEFDGTVRVHSYAPTSQ